MRAFNRHLKGGMGYFSQVWEAYLGCWHTACEDKRDISSLLSKYPRQALDTTLPER